MKYLQTDRRWADLNMDSVPYTLGRWGCTTTSIANGRESLGMSKMNPKELSDKVQYTKTGLFIWASLKNVGLELESYTYGYNEAKAKEALKSKDKFCIFEVDGWHWVLLWGMFPSLRIMDPLYGVRFLKPKYKNVTKTIIIKKI